MEQGGHKLDRPNLTEQPLSLTQIFLNEYKYFVFKEIWLLSQRLFCLRGCFVLETVLKALCSDAQRDDRARAVLSHSI